MERSDPWEYQQYEIGFVQQAIAQVLSEEYEKVFSRDSSYRPGRGCKDAIAKASEYVNQGLEWVIDLDLSKFFDTVNHSKLLQVLSNNIKDGRVISLIHRFMRAPISENGKVGHKTTSYPSGNLCRARHKAPYVDIDIMPS